MPCFHYRINLRVSNPGEAPEELYKKSRRTQSPAFLLTFLIQPELNRLGLRSALRTEFRTGRELVLAIRAFHFLLRGAAFGAELSSFAKLCTAFHTRHFCDFHLAATVRT